MSTTENRFYGTPDTEATWIVQIEETDTGCRRVSVRAQSEQSACIKAESEFGVIPISAYLWDGRITPGSERDPCGAR